MDHILKKAMEKRDEALREVERWETWIRAYAELAEPREPLEAPTPHSASPQIPPTDDLEIAPVLRVSGASAQGDKGKGGWLRNGGAN
jgi:hypothetical protein